MTDVHEDDEAGEQAADDETDWNDVEDGHEGLVLGFLACVVEEACGGD